MEKIINFIAPGNISRKGLIAKQQQSYLSEQSDHDDDQDTSSPIYKKKSHFGSPNPSVFKKPSNEEKKSNLESAFDTDESETNTPRNLKENFTKGASKNLHSKFRSATQVMKQELEKGIKTQKNQLQGDVDNTFPEEEIESSKKIRIAKPTFKEDKNDKNPEKPSQTPELNQEPDYSNLKKKDQKTRFMTTIVTGTVNSDAETKNLEQKQEKVKAVNNHPFRHLIFSPMVTESTLKKHLSITYRGVVYSVKCLKGPTDKFIKTKQVSLVDPKTPKKKTLLLDLDETLIHSCNIKENPQHILTAINEFGEKVSLGINIRPFCNDFLKIMIEYYDIFIFTASSPNYANTIINYIDPSGKLISGILTRVNCMETKNGFFIKDLRIIKNRDLKNLIIVDNLSHSFGFQIENGIPILEWHNDAKDTELKHLADYLIEAAQHDDVRVFNEARLKLKQLANYKAEDLGI